MTRAAILAALLVACRRQPVIVSCDSDLRGVWRAESGAAWMILDGGAQLEIYPLFADVPRSALEVAPRVIDLERADDGVTGLVHRRYMQRGEACDSKVPVKLTACSADALDLVMSDPAAPTGFAPCAWGRPESSHRERWRRD